MQAIQFLTGHAALEECIVIVWRLSFRKLTEEMTKKKSLVRKYVSLNRHYAVETRLAIFV